MVNVIDNEARNRSNMMPVGIKIIDEKGDVAHTAKTDLGTNYISLESKWFGSSSNNTGGSTGGNTTGGTTGGNTGGGNSGNTSGGSSSSQVAQLPSIVNLFTGSAAGNVLLSGPSANYDNVQDGLLITLSNQTLTIEDGTYGYIRMDLSSIGLQGIKIPKEKLVVNNLFDVSDQLSQYIGKAVTGQAYNGNDNSSWSNVPDTYNVIGFEGATIKVLPNTTLNMNLSMIVKDNHTGLSKDGLVIPVIQVNDYKN